MNKTVFLLMSSLPERYEKRCLNCESLIYGRYCQTCGQENVQHHVGFFHLVKHFIFDIFHFDGKFFRTVIWLFTRPGLPAREYAAGRRARHLDPIRLYVFTSAIFFLIFFKLTKPESFISTNTNTTHTTGSDSAATQKDTAVNVYMVNGFDISPYNTLAAFDSAQRVQPAGKRLGGLKKLVVRKAIHLRERYNVAGGEKMLALFISDFLHRLPQAMFVLLPLFALWLKLLYKRHSQWQYYDHSIFSLHFFVTGYVVILVMVILDRLASLPGMHWLKMASGFLLFVLLGYLYFGMRRFYGQPTGKRLLKFLLLVITGLFSLAVILAIFGIISLLTL